MIDREPKARKAPCFHLFARETKVGRELYFEKGEISVLSVLSDPPLGRRRP